LHRARDDLRDVVRVVRATLPAAQADAPSLLWSTFLSQADADEHALKAARDWIDKHCSD
jgi:hypothetical protein